MSTERGARTRLRFGSVSAPVALIKTAGKPPKDVQHETKRFEVDAEPVTAAEDLPAGAAVAVNERGQAVRGPLDGDALDPLGTMDAPSPALDRAARFEPPSVERAWYFPESVAPKTSPAEPPAPTVPDTEGVPAPVTRPTPDEPPAPPAVSRPFTPPTTGPAAPPREYVAPETRIEQGVHTETGEWVDLTDELEAIDVRTKVDGLEVVATIASNSIPRERVRDAHFVAGDDPASFKVLALLWRGLRETNRAAAVRWTPKTAPKLGIIVARGELGNSRNPAHLVVLELEWASAMRSPAPRVHGPIRAVVGADEVQAAVELVEAFAAGPSALNDLRDERQAKRAELIAAAREGRLAEYAPPAEPMPVGELEGLGVAEGLAAAAEWAREHVSA